MALQKEFTAKVFEAGSGDFLDSFTFAQSAGGLKNIPSFREQINGGQGEMVLDLNVPYDDFGEGETVAFMNRVELWVTDGDNPRGRRAYKGFISRYEPYSEGSSEGVRVICLGNVSLSALLHYQDGSSFTVTHTSQDPTVIFKAVIDFLSTAYPDRVSYDADSIPATVGTAVSLTFTDQRCSDALKKSGKEAGIGWWWSIDRDGKANFKAKPASATHTFTMGKDIQSIRTPKDSEKVVNSIQVRGASGATSDVSDATSISAYGKRTLIVNDAALGDAAARTQRGNKELGDAKDPRVTSPFVVNTNYDLESIRVGDTCRILNLKMGNEFYSDNMLIVGLTYDGDTVSIEVEDGSQTFGQSLSGMIGSQMPSSSSSGGGGGGTAAAFVDGETPAGTVGGGNTVFTLSQTPVAGSVHVYLADRMTPGAGNDYTISGTTITFAFPPTIAPIVDYRTSDGTFTFADNETPPEIVDGVNTTFTLLHTPVAGSLRLYSAERLTAGAGNDYTLSGTTITCLWPPTIPLLADYRY